jgi:beta-lactamase class A
MSRLASVSRRSLLAAGLAVPLTAATASASPTVDDQLRALEEKHQATLGVYAVNTRSGARVAYRSDVRIAFCSTFKGFATAAVLRDHDGCAPLSRRIFYPAADVMKNAPITAQHVDSGMTIAELATAALQYSDGTAGNLLLRQLGGPKGLTAFLRSIGDSTTRSDRWEPELWSAVPGDARDTTTPEALGRSYGRIMLGPVLRPRDRVQLVTWMKGNTTSGRRFRAGLPAAWTLADKTGTGDYGVANDVGVTWTTKGTPLLLSVMTTKTEKDAPVANDLVADTARVLAAVLAPGE